MKLTIPNPLINLWYVTDEDKPILYTIYADTRREELAQLTDWTIDQKDFFLRSQFQAQYDFYANNYKGADFWVIEYARQVIGRLYLQLYHQDDSIRIIDISLLSEWRNKGIGSQILLSVLSLAQEMDRPVTIHVETFNPAMQLYKKLGFQLLSETNGVYHLLKWKPKKAFNQNYN